jgi:putative transposase
MGSVGDAYDNAMAESFFATLEREVIDRHRFRSQVEARMAVFTWIESWYNPHRRHSSLGYRSPMNYERLALSRPSNAPLRQHPELLPLPRQTERRLHVMQNP